MTEQQAQLARQAQIAAKEVELETVGRQNRVLQEQINELLRMRDEVKDNPMVPLLPEVNPETKKLKEVLDMLKEEKRARERLAAEKRANDKAEQAAQDRAEAEARAQDEQIKRLAQERQEQEHLREEARERIEHEKRKIEHETNEEIKRIRLEAEREKNKAIELVGQGTGPQSATEKIDRVVAWMEEQKAKQTERDQKQQQLAQLKEQILAMSKPENYRACMMSGVNLFANLETIQEGGAVNLAEKAQAAMLAAQNVQKGGGDEGDGDSESIASIESLNVNKKQPLKSGLAIQTAHKIKCEVEWAHHNLGKEFEANPLMFNQLRLAHFMMGESEIILRSQNPKEMRAHLKLMKKLAYWQLRYDWASARNVYAAILRGIETGRETWDFDTREYEDMLAYPPPPDSQDSPKGRWG